MADSLSQFVRLLFYILCLHAIAIYFFGRGFLLTRNELPLFSKCEDVNTKIGVCNLTTVDDGQHVSEIQTQLGSSSDCGSEQKSDQINNDNSTSYSKKSKCWTLPAVKKVVILVLDALRFDFTVPSRYLTDYPKPWMDKLEVIQRLIAEERSRALLFKFIADPPTTSLQRLKGLTTGSLPTFIDVGNSFGAPAIVEDNIIHQFASNGKKVIMMGDDTWLQLFPTQFTRVHPFPSFNVKDLDTVDDGVIENLFPTLYEDNWDILIGHFLGVDHAGHIFGVESSHMTNKLVQYNQVLEDVISVLHNQSFPGGLHEDTLLLVMGDHGQTLNGDHGGGAPEEVETALFAFSTRQAPHSVYQCCNSSRSVYKIEESQSCICKFNQLDFAATMASILGIPIPFGSIGRVNPDLFSLASGIWPSFPRSYKHEGDELVLKWMKNYYQALCINSWQVNRYLKHYTESALNGFSQSDLLTVYSLYSHAQSAWDQISGAGQYTDLKAMLSDGIEKYTKYLEATASLARSKWTQFGGGKMIFGLLVLLCAIIIQLIALLKLSVLLPVRSYPNPEKQKKMHPILDIVQGCLVFIAYIVSVSFLISTVISYLSRSSWQLSLDQMSMVVLTGAVLGSAKSYLIASQGLFKLIQNIIDYIYTGLTALDPPGALAIVFIAAYACSLLSNSYILKEQQVVTFFLVSTGFLNLRRAIQVENKISQTVFFLGTNLMMGLLGCMNFSKDAELPVGTVSDSSQETIFMSYQLLILCLTVYLPFVVDLLLICKLLSKCSLLAKRFCKIGVSVLYMGICLHWLVGDLVKLQILDIPIAVQEFARLKIPQLVYFAVALQTVLLILNPMSTGHERSKLEIKEVLWEVSIPLLGIWSSLVILLLGRQGPLIALVAGIEGWCITEMQSLNMPITPSGIGDQNADYTISNVQWSLFAVQIFFVTGHRCAFDGLRYASAFIGFDEFNIYRQGVLLAIDTFGTSHVLPVLGLTILVAVRNPTRRDIPVDVFYRVQMSKAFLVFGLVRTITAAATTICVAIQRRHLMVWGLFAPKFVFDAIGLLVTDATIFLFALYCLPFL